MSLNSIATHYLSQFTQQGEFKGGMSFPTALRQSRLDFSIESLARVDYLLDQIRIRFNPDFDSFIQRRPNQNFLYLMCFYVAATIAKHGKHKASWVAYRAMCEMFPTYAGSHPECFATSINCIFADVGLFLPLAAIQERLFDDPAGDSIVVRAAQYLPDGANL